LKTNQLKNHTTAKTARLALMCAEKQLHWFVAFTFNWRRWKCKTWKWRTRQLLEDIIFMTKFTAQFSVQYTSGFFSVVVSFTSSIKAINSLTTAIRSGVHNHTVWQACYKSIDNLRQRRNTERASAPSYEVLNSTLGFVMWTVKLWFDLKKTSRWHRTRNSPAIWSVTFKSCNFRSFHFHVLHYHAPPPVFRRSIIFMPCDLVRHFHVVHFQPTRLIVDTHISHKPRQCQFLLNCPSVTSVSSMGSLYLLVYLK